jgi:hypothetical protein
MNAQPTTRTIDLETNLRRSESRSGRVFGVTAKFTRAEKEEIVTAAKDSQKAAGEWSREVLLHAARNRESNPLFTEIVGLRMLLVHLLEPLLAGSGLPPENVNKVMKTVREDKHSIAREVMQQYQAKSLQES